MSIETPAPTATPATPPATPPAPAQETDWKAEARKWEQRAKEYKPGHDKAAELEAAALTDAQRLTARADAAEAKVTAFEAREQIATWKAEVSTETGVPAAALSGSTLEDLQAHAAILKPLITPTDGRPRALAPYVPAEGGAPGGAVQDPGTIFAQFMSDALKR